MNHTKMCLFSGSMNILINSTEIAVIFMAHTFFFLPTVNSVYFDGHGADRCVTLDQYLDILPHCWKGSGF